MLLFFFLSAFFAFKANADTLDYGYVPANVNGYTINTDSRTPSYHTNREIEKAYKEKKLRNLRKIQDEYSNPSYDTVFIPVDEEKYDDKIKGYTKITTISPKPVDFATNVTEKLCSDIGFNKDSQRNALQFYSCLAKATKTKLTEETLRNTKFDKIDANIVEELKPDTSVDNFVSNLVEDQELLSQRNKMDCLKKDDYYKCTKAITDYKQCHNEVVEKALFEHDENKIICYVKTGIRFPNPNNREEFTRDAYFGVCIHLIEQNLRKDITKQNAKCNEILTKNNLLDIAL